MISVSQHGVFPTRQWEIWRRKVCIPPYLGSSYSKTKQGSSIHQESEHHWVDSQGGEGTPQRSVPTPQAVSAFHMWMWLGWTETALLRALPPKAAVPFKQSKGKLSLHCPLPVRSLGSQMLQHYRGLLDPSTYAALSVTAHHTKTTPWVYGPKVGVSSSSFGKHMKLCLEVLSWVSRGLNLSEQQNLPFETRPGFTNLYCDTGPTAFGLPVLWYCPVLPLMLLGTDHQKVLLHFDIRLKCWCVTLSSCAWCFTPIFYFWTLEASNCVSWALQVSITQHCVPRIQTSMLLCSNCYKAHFKTPPCLKMLLIFLCMKARAAFFHTLLIP